MNRFLLHHPNPAIVTAVAVLLVAGMPLGHAQLPNAWRITDDSTLGGSTLNYTTNLNAGQKIAATNSGWRLTVTSRLTRDFGSASPAMFIIYGNGTRRFGTDFNLNAAGQLTVTPLGGGTIVVETNASAATNYHVHQLTYDPATQTGTYRFNGTPMLTWAGQANAAQDGMAYWGSGSSAGRGEMHFHRAEFEIFSEGVIAVYGGGFAGNPSEAPDPVTQGWTRTAGATPIPEGPVSPDIVGFGPVFGNGLAGFPGINNGAIAAGDFDNDGRLDVIIAGRTNITPDTRIAQVWRNTGHGFTNIGLPLIGRDDAAVAWGDFDNDGLLDFVIGGSSSPGVPTEIWRNTGSGFSNINAGLPVISSGTLAWGDYDNDGRLDLLIMGNSSGGTAIAQVWRNTGNGFTNIQAGLTGVGGSSGGWADFDNDGRLDILLAGVVPGVGRVTELWRNTGNGFSNINAGLPGISLGVAVWGDYDQDGRPDILLAGFTGSQRIAQIWRNTGSGFSNINAGLPGVERANAAWGDYDNDGRLDVLISGLSSSGNIAQVWRNTGAGFTLAATLTGLQSAGVAWGDFDNDNRLDLLLGGIGTGGRVTELWQNLWPTPNTSPSPPGAPSLLFNHPGVLLAWEPATDHQTPSANLTYNLRVGTAPGGSDVVGPMAGADGVRRVARFGEAGHRTNAFLSLPPGTYYWSVQSIDSAFTGSEFAPEQSFEVPALPFVNTLAATLIGPLGATLNGAIDPNGLETAYYFEYGPDINYGSYTPTNSLPAGNGFIGISHAPPGLTPGIAWHYRAAGSNSAGVVFGDDVEVFIPELGPIHAGLPGLMAGSVAWGDFDNDGRLDLLLTGTTNAFTGAITQIWRNTAAGFTNIHAGLPGVYLGSAEWGDFDNDGLLDVLLAGFVPGAGRVTQVWRNTGNGFTNTHAGLPGVIGSATWGDFDNDGRLDILLAGESDTEAITQVWRNTGSGFSLFNAGLPGVSEGSVAWGDFDNDGLLDILLTGKTGAIQGWENIAQIWRNTGYGFSHINAGLPSVDNSQAVWGDFDQDGRLDVAIIGRTPTGAVAQVWRNTGTGFNNTGAVLPGVQLGAIAWGDFDNDGDPDLLLTGYDGSFSPLSHIRLNTGFSFMEAGANLPALGRSAVAWGDYDNDGRLDFVLAGTRSSFPPYDVMTEIWKNTAPPSNTPPTVPSGLTAIAEPPYTLLQWTAATDAETVTDGLTYNVRIGTSPGAGNVVSPHASPDGWRRVPRPGNAGSATRFRAQLTAGTYYWSVQAVDAAFAGSPFAAEGSFVVPAHPLAFTASASDVTVSGATLNGHVNPNGLETHWHFEYGTTTNYGAFTETNALPPGLDLLSVSRAIGGLPFGVMQHYRLVTVNSAGIAVGADMSFTTPQTLDLPFGATGGSVAWGDYDRDGLLDLLIAGWDSVGRTRVLRNTSEGFIEMDTGLPGLTSGQAIWMDFDNDGWLDILLAGSPVSGPPLQLWRNTGDGFVQVDAGFANHTYSSVAWGDFDNDGLPDLLLTGSTNGSVSGRVTEVWRNTGAGFTNIQAGITGVFQGSAVWADFDGDGRLDILVAGQTGAIESGGFHPTTCELWRNTGNGFVHDTNTGLSSAIGRHLAVADYDQDGLLDFVITGQTRAFAPFAPGSQFEAVSHLWRNAGNGFTNVMAGLPGVGGRPTWGDLDNDGRPDLLLTGMTNSQSSDTIAAVWLNTPGGFVPAEVPLPALTESAAAWGDFNNDGRLDIILSGDNPFAWGGIAHLWLNAGPVANMPPAAPENLSALATGNVVQFTWFPATDNETSADGLTYNLRVGMAPGGTDVLGPLAENSGFRLIPALGNAQSGTNALLTLPDGTYYWSVQAVDGAFAGSPFAPEQVVVISGSVAVAPYLTDLVMLGDGTFQFAFTNLTGASFTALATADPALPLDQWTVLGPVTEVLPGVYQFADPDAASLTRRFYGVRSP